MFKFNLKHEYYQRNKFGKIRYFVLVFSSRDSAPFLFGNIIHLLINYWFKNLLKIGCFLDEGPVHILYNKLCKNPTLS